MTAHDDILGAARGMDARVAAKPRPKRGKAEPLRLASDVALAPLSLRDVLGSASAALSGGGPPLFDAAVEACEEARR